MNWKEVLQRWQRWARARRSHRDTLSWLQRSPDELTILSERERAAADAAAAAAAKPAPSPSPASASPSASASPPPAPAVQPAPSPANSELTLVDDSTQPGGAVLGVLVAIDGELEGQVFSLREGRLQLGRSSSSDVVLGSRWISRDHARIECSHGSFVLTESATRRRW